MYIPAWLIVGLVIIGIYVYLQSRRKNSAVANKALTTEDMWRQAEALKAMVLAESPLPKEFLQNEIDMVEAMERDMVRLRERHKHDPQKQNEIARDWMDYANAVEELKSASVNLDLDGAWDRYGEATKKAWVAVQEIAKRVEEELGKDSSSRSVHDNLRKKADALDKISEEKARKSTKQITEKGIWFIASQDGLPIYWKNDKFWTEKEMEYYGKTGKAMEKDLDMLFPIFCEAWMALQYAKRHNLKDKQFGIVTNQEHWSDLLKMASENNVKAIALNPCIKDFEHECVLLTYTMDKVADLSKFNEEVKNGISFDNGEHGYDKKKHLTKNKQN